MRQLGIRDGASQRDHSVGESLSEEMVMVKTARPHAKSLLDLVPPETEGRNAAAAQWEKLDLLYVFVRDIAAPLRLPADEAPRMLAPLESARLELSSADAAAQLTHMLAGLNKRVLLQDIGIPDEFCCPLSFEPMVDPVEAEDGFTYERSAITDWLGRSATSPLTRQPMGKRLKPNRVLKQQIEKEAGEVDIARFTEVCSPEGG